jgi:hypothetical protein
MAGSGFRGGRWRPPAPSFPAPKRAGARFPDNLTAGPGGLIWIAMASPRDAMLDFLLPRAPWLRALIWSCLDLPGAGRS